MKSRRDQRQPFKNRVPGAVLLENVRSEQGLEDRRDHRGAGVGAPESKPWDLLRVNQPGQQGPPPLQSEGLQSRLTFPFRAWCLANDQLKPRDQARLGTTF